MTYLGQYGWALVIDLAGLINGLSALFLVLAFEPATYGRLGAMIGLASMIGPMAIVGSQVILIKRVATDDDPIDALGDGISVSVLGTLVATVVGATLAPVLVPGVDRLTVALFLLGQLGFFWMVELAISFTVGRADLRLGAALRVAATVLRVGAVVLFWLAGARTLRSWAIMSMFASAISVVLVHFLLRSVNGRLPRLRVPTIARLKEGFVFSFSETSEGVLAMSDRPILLDHGLAAGAGVYTAGSRIASMGLLPIMAVLKVFDRRVFGAGNRGISAALGATRQATRMSILVGSMVGVALFAAAPLANLLLPESYAASTSVIRWLALYPLLKGVQFTIGNALTSTGHQLSRLWLTVLAASANLVLNLIFIPLYGWQAAVATTLAAEALLTALLYGRVQQLLHRTLSSPRVGGEAS